MPWRCCCRGVDLLGAPADRQTIILVCLNSPQRDSVFCARARARAANFCAARPRISFDMGFTRCACVPASACVFSNVLYAPCTLQYLCASLPVCYLLLATSHTHSPPRNPCAWPLTNVPAEAVDRRLTNVPAEAQTSVHCLRRYVGQTSVPGSDGWKLPPQQEALEF